MSDFQPIVSSNLEAASYEKAKRVCQIRFKNGTAYEFSKFMPGLWTKFQKEFDGENGRSAGKFFFANIKGKLPFTQIENWK